VVSAIIGGRIREVAPPDPCIVTLAGVIHVRRVTTGGAVEDLADVLVGGIG
jgi:hypothetical protein